MAFIQLILFWTFLGIQASPGCYPPCVVKTTTDLTNKRVTEGVIWSEEGVDTRLSCVARCMQDGQCMTTGYSPGTGQCRGYNVDFTTPDNVTAVDEPGFNMFVVCRDDFIGKACATPSHCLGAHSICESGQCLCEIGYSHSRHRGYDTCDTDCTEYGSTFGSYNSRGIYRKNNKTIFGISVDQCRDTCISETDYLCKSFEYQMSSLKCNTMSYSWLQTDVADHNAVVKLAASSCYPPCDVKTFANKRVTEGLVWSEEGVDTRLSCVTKCMQDGQCMAAGYSPDTGQCRGHNVDVTSSDNVTAVDEPGSNMYFMCRALEFVGKTCNRSSDCLGARSVCESGQCLCEIGYSHSRHKGYDTCDTACTEYGTTFTPYSGHAILRSNTKTVVGISVASCKHLCLNETTFLCRSLEYDHAIQKCNTMSFSWLDKSTDVHRVLAGWTFFTRNCNL
ncbi:uncharacterized protein LOC124138202 [Haliotis rufescens]|uniref:uncharacterized protein LOC124138202 n=1 Tax=Haliotis rufescens TaxID=6454 RepID=UPI00201EEF9D|nr:uncharacterized protein LOC124138202 [Haliotis rufescens]